MFVIKFTFPFEILGAPAFILVRSFDKTPYTFLFKVGHINDLIYDSDVFCLLGNNGVIILSTTSLFRWGKRNSKPLCSVSFEFPLKNTVAI